MVFWRSSLSNIFNSSEKSYQLRCVAPKRYPFFNIQTARSKGYGFVQFQYPEVAQIAAETMNNYMILGRILKCHTLKNHQVNPFTFKDMRRKTKFVNWKRIFV
jgi:RNA recognition motif-containing protein